MDNFRKETKKDICHIMYTWNLKKIIQTNLFIET